MTQGIYCITNTITGRKYYGSSMNIESRLLSHQKDLISRKHHNLFLQRSVEKYGIDNFTFSIVLETDFSTQSELLILEQSYIDINSGGFNMAPANGGDLLSNHPLKDEIIAKRTATIIENNAKLTPQERKIKYGKPGDKNGMFGRCHTDETKKRIRDLNLGHSRNKGSKWNEQSKEKFSASLKGKRIGSDNPFYGKTHSAETKAILSEYQKQHNWTKGKSAEEIPYTKQYELTYPDGSSIIVYGLKELATYFKCSIANVKNTIDRMNKGSLPSKRSVFYNHLIKIMD